MSKQTKIPLNALTTRELKRELDETYRDSECPSFSVFLETIIYLGLREFGR